MKRNVGNADRVARLIIAALLGILVFAKVVTGTLAVVLAVVALIALFTGLVGWCGLYALLGINTNSCCGSSSEGDGKSGGCCCGHHKE